MISSSPPYFGLLRTQFPWLLVIFPLMIMFCLFGLGYLSNLLLPSLVLIVSTLYFTLTKQKPQIKEFLPKPLVENEITASKKDAQEANNMNKIHKNLDSTSQSEFVEYSLTSDEVSDYKELQQVENETTAVKKEAQEAAYYYMNQTHEMPDSISETEEDSEAEGVNESSVCSDGLISDEDSLIEIALPTGHYVSSNQEQESKFKLQQKMPDFMANAIFHQHSTSLMELLAEINEMNEENMIEIDISMGSIKCTRFEIEA